MTSVSLVYGYRRRPLGMVSTDWFADALISPKWNELDRVVELFYLPSMNTKLDREFWLSEVKFTSCWGGKQRLFWMLSCRRERRCWYRWIRADCNNCMSKFQTNQMKYQWSGITCFRTPCCVWCFQSVQQFPLSWKVRCLVMFPTLSWRSGSCYLPLKLSIVRVQQHHLVNLDSCQSVLFLREHLVSLGVISFS